MPADQIEQEYAPHFAAYKTRPSPETADALLRATQPVIRHGMATFVGPSAGPNVTSAARRLALDAFDSYDPSKGKLRTHVMNRLRGLQRYAAQSAQVISAPEQVALDRNHLRELETNLRDELGRDPSDRELADRSGLSVKRIGYIRSYRPGLAEGQLAGLSGDDEGEDWDPAVYYARGNELVGLLYHELHPVDQLIVEHMTGYNGAPILPMGDIARKAGLTPGRVSQRAAVIQAKLDELDDSGIL